jgi:hypothetical protein
MKPVRRLRIVALCLAMAASAVAFAKAAERAQIPDAQVVAWTEKRVTEWEPKAAERRFDEIGWAKDILTARQLAQKSERPVFIFTMDGRINIGRC